MRGEAGAWLRRISWVPIGVGALVLGGMLWVALFVDEPVEAGAFLFPAVFIGIGVAMRSFAGRLRSRRNTLSFETHGFWIFALFGLAVMAMGVIHGFDDPAALFAIPFGAVFVGAGFLMRKLIAVPKGKKRVFIPPYGIGPGKRPVGAAAPTTGTFVYADQGADEAQVIAEWRAEQLAKRPDWAARRIVEDG